MKLESNEELDQTTWIESHHLELESNYFELKSNYLELESNYMELESKLTWN